ncbi:MAG: hypothetical protein PVI78_07930 [Anaerolineales bacterium]|jgi:hypothetical protein
MVIVSGKPSVPMMMLAFGLSTILLIAGCRPDAIGPEAFPSDTETLPGNIAASEAPHLPCPSGPLFSSAPVDLEDISSVAPLGSLIPPGHTFPTPHLYLFVFGAEDTQGLPATVYAPGDILLTNIVFKYQESRESLGVYTDYDLHFLVCDEVELYFIHVHSISHPEIVAAMEAGDCPPTGVDRNFQECHLRVSIPIPVGSILGTTGDWEARIFGLDVGIRDYRLPHGRSAFANPDRWCDEFDPFIASHCYAACFFDYMPEDKAAPYLDRIRKGEGDQAIQRNEQPLCGTVYYDIAGSAQGYWFPSRDHVTTEADSLFLGPNDFLPSLSSFSIGNSIPGMRSFVYTFMPLASGGVNRPFDKILDNEVYCFDRLYDSLESLVVEAPHTMPFVILLQLSDDGQSLRIEKRDGEVCGSGPWSFSDRSVLFYR